MPVIYRAAQHGLFPGLGVPFQRRPRVLEAAAVAGASPGACRAPAAASPGTANPAPGPLSQAPLCAGNAWENSARCPQNMSDWTSLWYVWLLLLMVFLLLLCGVSASCIRFCCRKKRLPVEPFPRHPCDLAAIGIDSDSTAHSTVTSYSSWQYPPSVQIPSVFVDMDKNTVSPPAYSLYAMDLPPSYDEAVQMGKQVARTNQKLSDIPGQVTPGGLNPSQSPPDTISRDPATRANSEDSEDVTKEQPQV